MTMRHHQHILPPPAWIQWFPTVCTNGNCLDEPSKCHGLVIRLPRGSRVDDDYDPVIKFEVDLWHLGRGPGEGGVLRDAEGGGVKAVRGEGGGCH